ncbi:MULTISPECIES: RIP metalloprotease [unclassified Anaeromyxobacter]|uniref:M50 family metallopeptidase n=1 Tax=unclassified Anaeromyxobacter TaxID=2620896 RepID=UPI001F5A26A3|nr:MULTISPECIES: M50 family metallopeptidase [unclassified Anaeromyxobacter]
MSTVLAIAAAVLAVSLLIILHEAGHFFAARRSGMRVERFSVGFGPVVASFRRGETEFAISALPLGGYVRIAGMSPGDDVAPDDPTAYANQAAWRRFLVIVAGPAANYVTAVVVAAALLATIGLRAPDPAPRVGALMPGMPAAVAGLEPGDRILSVAGAPVDSFRALVAELQRHPGEPIVLELERGGERRSLPITPRDDGGVGRVGFAQAQVAVRRGPAGALVEGLRRTNAAAGAQLAAFGSMFSGKQRAELSGPVGIAQELVRGARQGAEPFLALVWTISIVLAILNLLPLPALDGGRLVFLAWEMITRRRVNEKVESYVHLAGFVALLVLIIAVTVFGDLARLLGR